MYFVCDGWKGAQHQPGKQRDYRKQHYIEQYLHAEEAERKPNDRARYYRQ